MTILKLLMTTSARVSYEDKWLVFDESTEEWVVYHKPPYAKSTRTLVRSEYQDEAVAALLGDDSDE